MDGHKQPTVSIVLLCYNYAHLLSRSLGSINEQTFKDFEVVFVNNGSTDNTDVVASKFFEEHPEINVNYIKIEKNEGVAGGDNTGAYNSLGKYIMFMDADDWMDPDCLETLVEAAIRTDADRIAGAFRFVNPEGKIIKINSVDGEEICRWRASMQQATLFKRSVYCGNNIRVSDVLWIDAEKTLKFSSVSNSVCFVPAVKYNYFVHDSTSNNNKIAEKVLSSENRYSFRNFIQCLKTEVYDKVPEVEKDACEFGIIAVYYSFILISARTASIRDAIRIYNKIRNSMIEFFPNYLSNRYILSDNSFGMQRSRRLSLSLFTICERMRLFKMTLTIFVFISRVHFFPA